jgi:hypothetical protein
MVVSWSHHQANEHTYYEYVDLLPRGTGSYYTVQNLSSLRHFVVEPKIKFNQNSKSLSLLYYTPFLSVDEVLEQTSFNWKILRN